ncbi:hypothetical protein GQ53DRAFT_865402 [Thozetella sp. PMI_491]|nr:hypothetical protein GQ53DRAFT_865402 [Thozetella sp. PMI_491]
MAAVLPQETWETPSLHPQITSPWTISPRETLNEADGTNDPFLKNDLSRNGSDVTYDGVAAGKPVYEQPKVVLETNIWRSIFGYGLVVHLLAAGATAGMVQLSFREIYWADDGDWNPKWFLFGLDSTATMNLLQFAAKLHEIFIVASLWLMVMHVTRRMLVGRGVPLGLLSGAYQVGSAEYFFSPSPHTTSESERVDLNLRFLSPFLWSAKNLHARMFLLSACTGLMIIYANMVGPSAAIAIIPNTDWFRMNNPWGSQLTAYIGNTESQVFPSTFYAPDNLKCSDALMNGTTSTFVCPAGGHDMLMAWALAQLSQSSGLDISMSEPLGQSSRLLMANVTTNTATKATVAMATTQTSVISALTGMFWTFVKKYRLGKVSTTARPRFSVESGDVYSPLVQVQCNATLRETIEDEELHFPYGGLLTFGSGSAPTAPLVVPSKYWNYQAPTGETIDVHWVNRTEMASGNGDDYRGTVGILVKLPVAAVPQDTGEPYRYSYVVPCVVDARWAATAISYDPNNDDMITSNLTSSSSLNSIAGDAADSGAAAREKYGISDLVRLTDDWIGNFDVPVESQYASQENTTIRSNIGSILAAFLNPSNASLGLSIFFSPNQNLSSTDELSSMYQGVAETVSTVLSLSIADGMSRTNYLGYNLIVSDGTLRDPDTYNAASLYLQSTTYSPNQTVEWDAWAKKDLEKASPYTFTSERYGWGYGLGNPTTQFGIAILLVHLLLLVIYISYLVVFRLFQHGWTSESWGDIGELVALASLSQPQSQLQHAGGGIDSWRTWRFGVRIRAVDDGSDRLQMLIGRNSEKHRKNENGTGIRRRKAYS